MLTITDPSDNDLGSLSLTAERGVASSHISIKIKNTGVSTVTGAEVTLMAEKTSGMGDYDTSGSPAVDERMGRFQVTGTDSTGTPGQTVSVTAAQPMGYLQRAVLPPILPGDAILADLWIQQASTSAGVLNVNLRVYIDNDSPSRPVGPGVTDVGRGIVTGVNASESDLLAGRLLTASGTPDDKVHIAAGSWLFQGVEGTAGSASNITLNQNDSASAALASGEAYIAAISQGLSGTPTVTKGLKASTTGAGPGAPSVPFGEMLLGFVTVNYGASGSVISSGNLAQTDLTYGHYLVTYPATGLTATVHTGRALIDNYMQRRDVKGDIALTNTATNYVWLNSDGTVSVTLTNVQPTPGALPLGNASTSGGNVTGSADTRTYIGQAGVLSAHAATHAFPGGTDPLDPATLGAATTTQLALKAPLASPTLTGTVTVPTPTFGDNSTKAASTAFVQAAIAAVEADHVQLWTSDGSTTSLTLSPIPSSVSIPKVWVASQRYVEGVDYTRTDLDSDGIDETVDWTGHVPTVGAQVVVDYKG